MKNEYTKYFYNITEDVKKINDIMKDYYFDDLIIAIYCINICVNNRSALESQLTLNLGLKTCMRTGKKRIKNYKDFKDFFRKIKPILDIDYDDDPICEDFGIVKFKFDNDVYNVILGTGYNSSYAQLHFLKPLSNLTCSKKEFKQVLKYNSDTINFFRDSNINDGKQIKRFTLPNSKLFMATKRFFKSIDFDLLIELNDILKVNNNYIEEQHFIEYNNKIYPLYNTSIFIDLYDKYYNKLSDNEKIELSDLGIADILSQIAKTDQGESPSVYFPVNLIDKKYYKIPYTFLLLSSNHTVNIGLNRDRLDNNDDLKNEIKKILKLVSENQLKIVESIKRNNNGYLGLAFTDKSKIKFVIHDSFTNLCNENLILGEKRESNIIECTALDLAYMFLFMENIDEIEEYIDYNDQNDYDQIMGFGGDSERFIMWKSFNHMFAKGALKFGLVNIELNTSDEYVIDYFKTKIADFPWNNSDNYLFNSPFSWNIECEGDNIYRYSNKINPTFFGYVKYLKNSGVIFFAHNLIFYNSDDIEYYKNVANIIDDINLRKLKTCDIFYNQLSLAGNNFIEVLFMPYNYAKKVGLKFDDDKKYVYSDCIINNGIVNIRYTVNYERIIQDIIHTNDRSVENEYIKELFSPLNRYFPDVYADLVRYLTDTKSQKKEVEVVQIGIDYIYNQSHKHFNIEDKYFLQAKKEIAKICLSNDIEPKEYYGKDANQVIRKMQKDLITYFEGEVIKYNQKDLHCKLLELYANSMHIIEIHRKRYNSITNVTEEVLDEVHTRIINERENEKRNLRTLLYLMETNLFLDRDVTNTISPDDIKRLLSFSDWLVSLSDSADICYFTDKDAHINVDFEYVVDNIIDNDIGNEYTKRVYDKNSYTIAGDKTDEEYILKVKDEFKKDTGLELDNLFDLCYFLQTKFEDYDFEQISSNVYEISKIQLIDNFYTLMNNSNADKKYSKEYINKLIDFMIIDRHLLKTCKGKEDFYLPINEREKRNNRFEVKPLVLIGDKMIFSPVIIHNVHDLWFNGVINFMLPFEIGLECTVKALLKWKKYYENKMVDDIRDIFVRNGIDFVKTNVYLHKIDKSGNYPLDLGDYDVIAIDDIKKIIWIIESKYISRVASFFEMYSQQKNFFLEHKYDEKFQKRIDFLSVNYKKVLKSLGFNDVTNYRISPYMVFNKVFMSRYKHIEFPIISIIELEDEIKK